MWGVELAVMAGMIALNSVFAAYEIALASVSLTQLQMLQSQRKAGASFAVSMKDNMEASLAVVQLGITLVGAIAAAVGGAGPADEVSQWLQSQFALTRPVSHSLSIAMVVIPLTVVTIILGELVPKVFALKNQARVVLTLSPIMYGFSISVWPAVWFLEGTSTFITDWIDRIVSFRLTGKPPEPSHVQELRAMASLARASRLIGAREEKIILSAARLSSRTIREIMLPAEHISMMPVGDPLSECLIAAHRDMHTRFPVTEASGDPQRIIGYVNFKDIVSALRLSPQNPSLRAILRPIPSYTDVTIISHCLERMIHEHSHIALVRDKENRVLGMITLEDIVEELLGEIEDEHQKLPTHCIGHEATWVVGGGLDLTRLKEVTGIDLTSDLPEPHVRKVSEWITGHLGHGAVGGEELERSGVRVLVRKIRLQQVLEAQVTRLRPADDEESDDASLQPDPPETDDIAPGI
jgi:putative hemolysin